MICPKGTNIYAALSGKVITAGWSDIYGNYVVVSHHSGYKTLYGHLSKISVKAGQSVTTATKLGEAGSTGISRENHLHFSVYKNNAAINPLEVMPHIYAEVQESSVDSNASGFWLDKLED